VSPLARNRKFESISLQRRVSCEPFPRGAIGRRSSLPIAWGATHVFGVVGDDINSRIEVLRRRQDRIRYVGVRHEEAAAFMASGYTKHNGRLGICVGTTGPGAIHLLNGLYDACFDGAPLVALTATTSISGLAKPTRWSPTSRPPG
jgi:TPP-dependent trihydroxycyclohexane-1,2-dione (THcHDO) dehydratase